MTEASALPSAPEKKYFFLEAIERARENYRALGRPIEHFNTYIRLAKQGINPLYQFVKDCEEELVRQAANREAAVQELGQLRVREERACLDGAVQELVKVTSRIEECENIISPQNGEQPVLTRQAIDGIIAKAKETREYWENYEAIKESMERVRTLARDIRNAKGEDIIEICDKYFDSRRDADLLVHALFIHPKIREEFGDKIENFYHAHLRYQDERRKGERELRRRTGKPRDTPPEEPTSPEDLARGERFLEGLEELIKVLPADLFSKDDESYDGLRKLIRKKANRDAFVHFKKDIAAGLRYLERMIKEADNKNVRIVYKDVYSHYRNYQEFTFVGENKDFADPVTKQKGCFPSLHQRTGVYHALDKQRFGILDGCGTGKTAIGALIYPLVVQKKKAQGKKAHNRVLVLGTIPCLKIWRLGLEGGDHERYLAEKRKVVVVNGDRKDGKLYEELKRAEFVFANYQQLTTTFKINGEERPTYQVLAELGYDLIVCDEVHQIANLNKLTASKKESYSGAARYNAFSDPDAYFLALSGTPMRDNIEDYAMIYHLLRPDLCDKPEKFVDMIRNEIRHNPHMLSTFVDENTLRRTAEEVNDLIEIDDNWYEDIEISDAQRKIHDYLFSHRPVGCLIEARKALSDPRLVDPRILQKLDLLGKVGMRDSAKCRRLEELLTAEDGPIAQGEKFVVFSSILKEGITRTAENIAQAYQELGLDPSALKLEDSLVKVIDEAIKKRFGSGKYIRVIDGEVGMHEREELVNRFRQDPNLVGLVCTTDTGGESLDLSHATHAYFLDEDYSPSTTEQAIARLWRRGQSKEVRIKFLRGKNTFDEDITDYVEQKNRAIKAALDGIPLSEDHVKLLQEGKEHGELMKMIERHFGGLSIDASEYKGFDISDIVVRESKPPKESAGKAPIHNSSYETTRAQEIGMRIGKDRRCWFDPEFAKLYAESLSSLAPYLMNRARILDLLSRARRKEIAFPRKVLALAAGPSTLWAAYQELRQLMRKQGFAVPDVYDLDYSPEMQRFALNPLKVCADMRTLPFADESFDLVDNGSVSLLDNEHAVARSLREANRVLVRDGLLELAVKDLYFMEGFADALEDLGFEVLSRKHASHGLSKHAYKKLSEAHGPGFAEAFRRKLDKAHFILARKVSRPSKTIDASTLWFLTDLGERFQRFEDETGPENKPLEQPLPGDGLDPNWNLFQAAGLPKGNLPNQKRKRRRKAPAQPDDGPTYHRPYRINPDGTVDPL
jgi:superfamily II DNA or RNA helicase/ubiquinone/menaquinone biosynthesis C-methylase UbiE